MWEQFTEAIEFYVTGQADPIEYILLLLLALVCFAAARNEK